MKTSRRLAWLVFILGLGLLVAIPFRAFILANFVTPIALVLWLLWRVVQSVHQSLYWGLLIMVIGGVACYRLVKAADAAQAAVPPSPETTLKSIKYWQTWILPTNADAGASSPLKRELAQMLVSIYASKAPEATPFSLYEALRLRKIPLPASIFAFVYPDEMLEARPGWRRRLQGWAERPGKWLRQWTGRDQADYYRSIEETLAFMEALMEIKHGDDYFDPAKH